MMTTRAPSLMNWSSITDRIRQFGSILTVLAIAVFGFWGGHFLLPGTDHAESEPAAETGGEEPTTVSLTAGKLSAIQIQCAEVQSERFQEHQSIPGTIVYDATRKVEIRATVSCVVTEAVVKQTQTVAAGDRLLVLSSPEIGAARDQIQQAESNLELTAKEYDWTLDTHTNIKALLTLLSQSPSNDQIEASLADRNLGEHRNEILSAYSELSLARKMAEQADQLERQGALAGKTAAQRRSSFEIAAARFKSISEELTFQTRQGLIRAQANLDAARRHLDISREELAALMGRHAIDPATDSGTTTTAGFVCNAPRSGQVVELPAVESLRFEPGEVMAVIADTAGVWVEAQISQRDWQSLSLTPDQQITVRVPALGDEPFEATVRHVGSAVSPATMAIPLIAELDNPQGLLRPGLAVWVDIPTSQPRSAIVVPAGAVQRNNMETFVFVQQSEGLFQRRNVVTGAETSDRVEIQSGLAIGDRLVTEGAFFLKSELLLSEEE